MRTVEQLNVVFDTINLGYPTRYKFLLLITKVTCYLTCSDASTAVTSPEKTPTWFFLEDLRRQATVIKKKATAVKDVARAAGTAVDPVLPVHQIRLLREAAEHNLATVPPTSSASRWDDFCAALVVMILISTPGPRVMRMLVKPTTKSMSVITDSDGRRRYHVHDLHLGGKTKTPFYCIYNHVLTGYMDVWVTIRTPGFGLLPDKQHRPIFYDPVRFTSAKSARSYFQRLVRRFTKQVLGRACGPHLFRSLQVDPSLQ